MSKLWEFVKSFFAIILIIISFGFMNAYMALQSTSRLISKENITKVIKETDFEDLIDQVNREELYEELKDSGVTKETVDSMLDNEQFKETVGDLISEGLVSLVEGDKMSADAKEKYSKDLIEVFDSVVKENKIKLTNKEIQEAHQNIEESVGELVDSINKSGIIEAIKNDEEADEDVASLRDGVEAVRIVYKNRVWFLVVSLVFLALAGLLKLKDYKFLKWIGGTLVFYGVTFLSFGKSVLTAFSEMFVGEAERYKNILESSISTMAKTYYIAGFIFLILGVILIAAKPVYEKFIAKKEITEETV